MNAALRCLIGLAAVFVVSAAAAQTAGDPPSYFPVRLGASRVAIVESDNRASRLLRVPGYRGMTPRNMPGWMDDLEFLDRRTGWLAASDCAAGKGVIARTDNGGRTWRTLATRFSHSCAAGATLDLSFVDKRNGWLVWFEPTGRFAELYRTEDGGRSWRLIVGRRGVPRVERVVFVTPTTGWGDVVGLASGPRPLLRTADSGRSWEREPQLPIGRYALPVLSGRDGVVAATVRWSVFLYSSRDGGHHWRLRSRLRFGGSVGDPELFSPRPGIWWVTATSARRTFLAVTRDGGRSWTRSAVDLPGRGFSVVPTSERRAWASSGGKLFVTADAGRTWRRVALG